MAIENNQPARRRGKYVAIGISIAVVAAGVAALYAAKRRREAEVKSANKLQID